MSIKINQKQLKALYKRYTNKEIALQLGVSTKTVYRYRKGITKKPQIDINNDLSNLWETAKHHKPVKSVKDKKHYIDEDNRELKYADDTLIYESSNTEHHIYELNPDVFRYRKTKGKNSLFEKQIENYINKLKDKYKHIEDKLFSFAIGGTMQDASGFLREGFINTRWHLGEKGIDFNLLMENFKELNQIYGLKKINNFEVKVLIQK